MILKPDTDTDTDTNPAANPAQVRDVREPRQPKSAKQSQEAGAPTCMSIMRDSVILADSSGKITILEVRGWVQ